MKKETNYSGKKPIFVFVSILFLLALASTAFAAQDFIIENKTSALFAVNGTTGNIFMAPSFGKVGDLK